MFIENKKFQIAAAALIGVGAVMVGKTVADELSRPKAAASGSLVPGTATPENPGQPFATPIDQQIRRVTPEDPESIAMASVTATIARASTAPIESAPAAGGTPPEPPKKPTTGPTPESESTKVPTVAPTKEAIQEVPCGILPTEYCSKAEIVNWKNQAGKNFIVMGFRDLPADLSVSQFGDGQSSTVKLPDDGVFKGVEVMMFNSDKTQQINLDGDLTPDPRLPVNEGVMTDRKKGEVVNQIQKTGVTNAGDYQLLVYVLHIENGKTTVDEEALRKMFRF